MLRDLPVEEQAARIRAAIGWSGKEVGEIVAGLPFSEQTFRRRYDRNDPKPVKSMDELYLIADACDVPRAFMDEGWSRYDGIDGSDPVLDRLTRAEETLARMREGLEQLQDQVDGVADDAERGLAELRAELLGRVQDAAGAAIARGSSSPPAARGRNHRERGSGD